MSHYSPDAALESAKRDAATFSLANCIRALSIDAVEAANSGHPVPQWVWPMLLRSFSKAI